MGIVKANIELINFADKVLAKTISNHTVRSVKTDSLVDSGSYVLAINEVIQSQLGLEVLRRTPAELADGKLTTFDMVGPIEVKFENRACLVEAIVLPGNAEVLLGAIPMEYMDVLIDMRSQKLIINPEHPYMAVLKVK